MFEQFRAEECAKKLNTHITRGLSEQEAGRRLLANGRNELKEKRKETAVEMFWSQLNDPLIFVLLIAALVSILLGEYSDAMIIGTVVILNAVIGTIQEGKASRALDALKKLSSPKAMVVRDGVCRETDAGELVTGDLVYLETGCQVPADLRLSFTANLKIEESALTGESLPVEKDSGFLVAEGRNTSIGDRYNMAYMSTIVTYGRGYGIVVATGMHTQIGQIAGMISRHREEMTPLQKRLGDLGKVLSVLSLLLCGALFGISVWQRQNMLKMLLTAISLAVAAVPEGLPAVVTICLALSVTRMVKANAIIRRLPCVETLGSVSVVCTDKTGTLTQNKMTVEECFFENMEGGTKNPPDLLLKGMVLCNDASLEGEGVGDPTELALLEYGRRFGYEKKELEVQLPRIGELPFDSERKMMSTCHKMDRKGSICFTKGAVDRVLGKCSMMYRNGRIEPLNRDCRDRILEFAQMLSKRALRTLVIAMKRMDSAGTGENITEEQLVYLGLVGMLDPDRPEAKRAVDQFRLAGVKTVMITGDHVDTAYAIARRTGIAHDFSECITGDEMLSMGEKELRNRLQELRVFARVSPAQKVQIVEGFQQLGEIVAMTGDGVNDAPSLKGADIGIAMGRKGTDVAKQAADMVLTDDNFASIERAIEEGRGVYENIRKSVIFLLSSNMGELLTMFLAVLANLAAPLKSSHILWINLITDSLPALALGVDANDMEHLMRQKPRRAGESLFSRGGLLTTFFYGAMISAASLAAFLVIPCEMLREVGCEINLQNIGSILYTETVLRRSQTYAFTVLAMSQLFHAIGMRDMSKSVLGRRLFENKLMLLAFGCGLALQVCVTEIPFLVKAFGTASLSLSEWVKLGCLSMLPLVVHEIFAVFGEKLFANSEKNGMIIDSKSKNEMR